MATHWEHLAGDTSAFAIKLAFMDDPDEQQGASDDVSLSWGAFQIWVNGWNLCTHLEEGERVESAHWYLLPLLEWFVHQWNPLLHEERLPCEAADEAWTGLRGTRFPPPALDEGQESDWESAWHGWWSRHAIRAAREGGVFPDVIFRRFQDSIEISWGDSRSQGVPDHVSFAQRPGAVRFEPKRVAEPLYDALEGAAAYLSSVAPHSNRIADLKRTIRRVRTPHKDSRVMWLAGLGVDKVSVRQGWNRFKRQIAMFPKPQQSVLLATSGNSQLVVEGSCHAALMFGSMAPNVAKSDVMVLAESLLRLTSPEGDPETMASRCRAEPIGNSDESPWQQGYALAEELQNDLDGRVDGERVDVEAILDHLGVEVTDANLSDGAIRGVAIAGPRHRSGIVWNRNNHFNADARGLRFTLAHELCHLLFDRSAGQRLAVASGPWAPPSLEQRANAFAAMLLMPTETVRTLVVGMTEPVDTAQGVSSVARRLETGFPATLWHLRNLGFVDDSSMQRIEAERQRL